MKIILFSAKAQNGKDLTATLLEKLMIADNKKVLITHYADLLKYLCKTFFDWDGKKDDVGRNKLQYLGTDVIRKQNPDYWVKFLSEFLQMFKDEWSYVLIPDTRFPNEITYMKECGFDVISVRIKRLNFESDLTDEQKNHLSETALDDFKFDYYLESESGIDCLKDEVVKLYDYIKGCE